jgi:hypothetical protein
MQPHTLLVLDDIRLLPMVTLWEDLRLRKLDLTSFGHWSGTGIAQREGIESSESGDEG